MSDAPEQIEYVVVPIERDVGEIDLSDGQGKPAMVTVTLADIGAGMTVIAAPEDLPPEQAQRLMAVLHKREREMNGETKFILLRDGAEGKLPRWDFVRLVRKDRWDATFREERPGPVAT